MEKWTEHNEYLRLILDEPERALLSRLAIFRGGFTALTSSSGLL